MRKKQVTLGDIAQQAGVSIATVSYVLNNYKNSRISDETRQRVMETAEQLNYRPNVNARILKGKGSSTVGLIIPSIRNYYYPELTEGVTVRANEIDYNIALFNTNDDLQKEKAAFDTLRSMQAAGVIVAGIASSCEEELQLFNEMSESGMPIICVDRYHIPSAVPTVSIDQRKASYDMTRCLLHEGHKRIALVLPIIQHDQMVERREGFEQAMHEYGGIISETTVFYVDTVGLANIAEEIQNILSAIPAFSAIYFACGDLIAIEAIRCLKRCGVRVPKDISVAGFDGIDVGEIISPTLTTVKQPIYEMGYEAMRLLEQGIRQRKSAYTDLRLPHTIAMRESTEKLSFY